MIPEDPLLAVRIQSIRRTAASSHAIRDIVRRLHHGRVSKDVEKIVDALFDEITASLARGKRIELLAHLM
jgi:nucleoid DNA-binding protein